LLKKNGRALGERKYICLKREKQRKGNVTCVLLRPPDGGKDRGHGRQFKKKKWIRPWEALWKGKKPLEQKQGPRGEPGGGKREGKRDLGSTPAGSKGGQTQDDFKGKPGGCGPKAGGMPLGWRGGGKGQSYKEGM